jgi:hypothetical protein
LPAGETPTSQEIESSLQSIMDYYREVDIRAGQVKKRRPQSEAQREILDLQQPGSTSMTVSGSQEGQLSREKGLERVSSEEGGGLGSDTEPSLREGDSCVCLYS